MKNILLLAIVTLGLHSCHVNMGKKVRGNGKLTTIERDVADASRIKVLGSMNIVLASGPTGLKVEADENLVPYIITEIQDGWLVIKTRDNVNFRTKNPINVYVSTDILHAIHLSGSGNVTGTGKFKDPKNLAIQLTGSGDVRLDVNSPEVAVNLRGSGSVVLSGETRDAKVEISGSGDYKAEDLKTEHTDVAIRGSGDARLHAEVTLDATIRGSGSIYYRGNASVKSSTSGSGKVQPLP